MNLTKTEFKSQYSNFRRDLKSSYKLGIEDFRKTMRSNLFFSEIYANCNDKKPVSIKVWIYINYKNERI
jgi:hypothetical protein